MRQTLLAGTTYFSGIFALGFLLGTLRVLVFSALLDETILVLIEVPIILCASWVFCRYLIAKLPVAPRIADRILMGGAALALLLTAEMQRLFLVLIGQFPIILRITQRQPARSVCSASCCSQRFLWCNSNCRKRPSLHGETLKHDACIRPDQLDSSSADDLSKANERVPEPHTATRIRWTNVISQNLLPTI